MLQSLTQAKMMVSPQTDSTEMLLQHELKDFSLRYRLDAIPLGTELCLESVTL